MKTFKTFLALAALATVILTQSCASVKEASTFEPFEDCPQYESDGYHTTICWDQKSLTDEL